MPKRLSSSDIAKAVLETVACLASIIAAVVAILIYLRG